MTLRALVGVGVVFAVVLSHGWFGRDQGPDGVRGVAQPFPSVTALPLPPKATRLPCAGGVRGAETPTAGEVSRPYGGSMASPEPSGNPAGAGWVSVSAPARNSSAPHSRKDNRIRLGAVRTKAAGCEVTPRGVSPIARPAAGYFGGEHGTVEGCCLDCRWNPYLPVGDMGREGIVINGLASVRWRSDSRMVSVLRGSQAVLATNRETGDGVRAVAHAVRQTPRGGVADGAWNHCVYTQYAVRFEGRRCADGSRFSHRRLIVAARGIPLGTRVKLAYGQRGACTAIVADTGRLQLHRPGRVQFDVSQAVARRLGLYSPKNGRRGKWRKE